MPPKHHSYVWRHGWHYGWYRSKNLQYAWNGDKYYAWNPGAAVGLATLPLALATGGLPYYTNIRIIISKFRCPHDGNSPDGAKIVASRSRRLWIARTQNRK